jgi:UDP-glucose 4-epimerase
MTILVTGSSGFIGSNLIEFFKKKKIKFIGIDKIKNPYLKHSSLIKLNLLNKKALETVIIKKKIKYIIHLAAIPGFVSCHNNPDKAFKNNIEATFNLILAAQKGKVKNILIASSMGVDNFEKNPSIYGLTKLVCEKISKTFVNVHKSNIKTLKISNVFGPYSMHKSSVIHSFIKKILSKKKILIHKSGRQERDFVFVGDVCKKLLKEIYKKDTKQEIVINTNKFLRVLDIKNLLQKISQKKIEYTYVATPKGYDDKIYSKPIMKINNNFMKNLELTYNWYKSF